MARKRPRHLKEEQARRVLQVVVGSSAQTVVLLVSLALVFLGLFINGLSDMVQRGFAQYTGDDWIKAVLLLAPFPVLLGLLLLRTQNVQGEVRPIIRMDERPRQVRALVLFLSPVRSAAGLVRGVIDGTEAGGLFDAGFRERLQNDAWRMPLEAIAWHADPQRKDQGGRLREVVVVPSADRAREDAATGGVSFGGGTYREVETFAAFVRRLCGPQADGLRIRSLHELLTSRGDEGPDAGSAKSAGGADRISASRDYSEGVNFESMEELVDALNDAYRALHRLEIDEDDILVDVTGGQKPCSIAGAVVALAEGRRFQYISTHDWRVRAYTVTYLQ